MPITDIRNPFTFFQIVKEQPFQGSGFRDQDSVIPNPISIFPITEDRRLLQTLCAK